MISTLLCIAFGATVLYASTSGMESMHFFQYNWTINREFDNYDKVRDLYAKNTALTTAALDTLRASAMRMLYCFPVTFTGYVWGEDQISPQCNCMMNLHDEYVHALSALPSGTTSVPVTSAGDIKIITDAMRNRCFNRARHTRVLEQLSAGLTTASGANTVVLCMLWNLMSLLCGVVMLVRFRLLSHAVAGEKRRMHPSNTIATMMFTIPGILTVVLLLAGIISVSTAVGFTWWSVLMPVVFLAGVIGLWINYYQDRYNSQFVCDVFFWWTYAFNIMVVFTINNTAVQQRDANINRMVALLCFGAGMVLMVAQMMVLIKDNVAVNNMRTRIIQMAVGVLLILYVVVYTGPTDTNPVINLNYVSPMVVLLMIMLGGYQNTKAGVENSGGRLKNWIAIDLLCRFLITIPVMQDIVNVTSVDNGIIRMI